MKENYLSLQELQSLIGLLLFFFMHSVEKQKCIPALEDESQSGFSQNSAMFPMERTISTNNELPLGFKISAQNAQRKQGGGLP